MDFYKAFPLNTRTKQSKSIKIMFLICWFSSSHDTVLIVA